MTDPKSTSRPSGEETKAPGQAQHGYRNEVNWGDGEGRQPYGNQGMEEAPPAAGGEEPQGNRGERSGRNLDQLEEVKRKP
jgi:hypothetical protein